MTVEQARKNEAEWFKENEIYKEMDPRLFGVGNLTEKLKDLLFSLIKDYMPQIETDIREKVKSNQQELNEIGEAGPSDDQSRLAFICENI